MVILAMLVVATIAVVIESAITIVETTIRMITPKISLIGIFPIIVMVVVVTSEAASTARIIRSLAIIIITLGVVVRVCSSAFPIIATIHGLVFADKLVERLVDLIIHRCVLFV